MDDAIKQASLVTAPAGEMRYFYDAFKSKAENDRLRAEHLAYYNHQQEALFVQSAIESDKSRFRMNSRFLVAVVPVLPYVAHYFFRQQKNALACCTLLIMLITAFYFIWDFYFDPIDIATPLQPSGRVIKS